MGFAAFALIMTSCSKQDVAENITDGQGQLSFSAGTAQQGTRAAELNNTSLQSNDITLYAYQNVGGTWSKWYNDVIKYAGGKWSLTNSVRFRNVNATKYITYSSKVNGALTNHINFIDADFGATNGKFPQFTYNVQDNSTTQEDLIAGITEVDANKTDITLGMRHILSQVNFGTVGYTGAKIQIQNIKIVGVKYKGTFTYNDKDEYPIGAWSDLTPTPPTTDYDYYNWGGLVANNPQPPVAATAVKGDKYIFGDGGNAGPGITNVLYPDPTDSGKWKTPAARSTGLANSLMLLPQTLTGAKVTFEYKIQDESDAYVAGGPSDTDWAKGEFSLDFSTGTTSGTHYLGKWEQNYRYVYIIDFTDFLDDNKLSFKVDVDMYEWENYNKPGDNNGIVGVPVIGQTTNEAFNTPFTGVENGIVWHAATRSRTAPTSDVQLITSETWKWENYNFVGLASGQSFTINFSSVIFNGKSLIINVGTGYQIYSGTEADAQTVTISAATQTVTIKKK